MLPGDFPNWPVVYKYFRQWNQKTSEESFSLLKQALKKWGWRGPDQPWSEREDNVRDC